MVRLLEIYGVLNSFYKEDEESAVMNRRGEEKSREMMLDELLGYDRVTIQCHDNPDADAIASGFGLYCFFRDQGKDVRFLYSGKNRVRKANLTLMV